MSDIPRQTQQGAIIDLKQASETEYFLHHGDYSSSFITSAPQCRIFRYTDSKMPILQFVCVALFYALGFHLLYTRLAWLIPFFTTLCFVSGTHLLFWTPHAHTWFYVMEPITLSFQACAAIETFLFAARRLPARESRAILVLLAGLGTAVAFKVWGVIDSTDLMGNYKALRLEVHVFLSMATVFGALVLMIKPVKFTRFEIGHAAILTVYLLKFTVIELVRGRATSEDDVYQWFLKMGMIWTALCTSAWLIFANYQSGTQSPGCRPASNRTGD